MSRLILMKWADERRAEAAALANPVTAPAVMAAEAASLLDDGSLPRRIVLLIFIMPLTMAIEYGLYSAFVALFGVISIPLWAWVMFAGFGLAGILGYMLGSGKWFAGIMMLVAASPKLNFFLKILDALV